MKSILLICSFLLVHAAYSQAKTITVAQDGSGDFITVQAALDAVPLNNGQPVTIFIRKGIYKEKLHLLPSKNFVRMVGEDREGTILTYDDHSGKPAPNGTTINTYTSRSFLVEANDFTAINLTFQNTAGPTAGQAVAVSIMGDRASFINCRILGNQDTLYAGMERGRAYFSHCYIDGTTDFIFGPATALFDNCHLHSKKNSHVTAASTPKEIEYGYVFRGCKLTADPGINKVTLGRPWQPFASVTYMNCSIGSHIIPAGWDNWRNPENEKTARYAEYKNRGPGANTSGRVSWSRQLTRKEAKKITLKTVLRGWDPARK